MNVLLALTALFVFLISLPIFFSGWLTKIGKKLEIQSKEVDGLKQALEIAKQTGTISDIDKAQKDYNEKMSNGCFTLLGGCLMAILTTAGQIVLLVLEIVVIIAALTMHIGIPLLGYLALAVYIVATIINIILPSYVLKAIKKAEAVGNVYAPKTNYFLKIFGWLPDLYALYIVLVIIGLLA